VSIFKSIGAMAGAVASNPLTKMLAAQFLPGALPVVNLVADAVSGIAPRRDTQRAFDWCSVVERIGRAGPSG